MTQNSGYNLNLQEGTISNYFNALEKHFDGKRTKNLFDYEKGNTYIKISNHPFGEEFELALLQLLLNKPLHINRLPDNRADFFHLTLLKEGLITRQFQNKQQNAEAGTALGLFIHNGLFTLDSLYPAQLGIRSVSVKFSLSATERFIPESKSLLNSLFDDDEPKAYHTHVSPELEKMMDDLFFYENVEFGSKALVLGRGLELFTLLLSSLKQQLDKEDLHGLHIDDYKRLLKIKDYVLNKLDAKINMNEIGELFGISISKLKRDFKTLYDTTVQQFYTHAKMDEAYRRLRTGNFSVTEVGYDMGYNNVSKFSSMFKKVKGIYPKDVIPV